jgi:hypothetical protein
LSDRCSFLSLPFALVPPAFGGRARGERGEGKETLLDRPISTTFTSEWFTLCPLGPDLPSREGGRKVLKERPTDRH